MKATQKLHDLGQSLWLDNITRDLLNSGTLKRYIGELSVTGLTSNPTIFDHAIKSSSYDVAIREGLEKGKSGESLFFDLALDDLTRAADLFRPINDRTNGVDGWVSLEVSPLLAHDTTSTIAAAKKLSARAGRPNLFIKIPGNQGRFASDRGSDFCRRAGQRDAPIFTRAICGSGRGVFERHRTAHRRRTQSAGRLRGLDVHQPLGCGRDMGKVPKTLDNRLGIAIAGRIYQAYLKLLNNPRSQRAYNAGARPQRLLWASTGTKIPRPRTFSTSKLSHRLSP
jgi:transaldolase